MFQGYFNCPNQKYIYIYIYSLQKSIDPNEIGKLWALFTILTFSFDIGVI